jgi:hypothetical protein
VDSCVQLFRQIVERCTCHLLIKMCYDLLVKIRESARADAETNDCMTAISVTQGYPNCYSLFQTAWERTCALPQASPYARGIPCGAHMFLLSQRVCSCRDVLEASLQKGLLERAADAKRQLRDFE